MGGVASEVFEMAIIGLVCTYVHTIFVCTYVHTTCLRNEKIHQKPGIPGQIFHWYLTWHNFGPTILKASAALGVIDQLGEWLTPSAPMQAEVRLDPNESTNALEQPRRSPGWGFGRGRAV